MSRIKRPLTKRQVLAELRDTRDWYEDRARNLHRNREYGTEHDHAAEAECWTAAGVLRRAIRIVLRLEVT